MAAAGEDAFELPPMFMFLLGIRLKLWEACWERWGGSDKECECPLFEAVEAEVEVEVEAEVEVELEVEKEAETEAEEGVK
ncbi:hypothetical protein VSDG_03644 [Cytospora chrysosperma]|uniref:Uncharacterized protein n=1 Tax=Cytospora chrysosperma TaxID=252740 RepID=A0A423WA90_CYTCH|nr:hypothetical protein VSDG_03644 [Valsa sordida]